MKTSDVLVVGLGAMGSAALYQLARRGIAVTGIDRFTPPHDRGSSHGESRITRQAIGEGDEYVPFALRSHEIWRELEADTGRPLLSAVGGLIIGRRTDAGIHGRADFIGSTIAAAQRYHIDHEVLAPAEVVKRFPQFKLAGDETCYYEPGAGFVRPEECIAAQIDRARAHGAVIRADEVATRITADATSVTVVTRAATYTAPRAIVTAGAWLPDLLGGTFAQTLRVYPQSMHWFEPDDEKAFAPGRFPIFIWRYGGGEDDHFYGFPVVGSGVKVATEQFSRTAKPDDPNGERAASGRPAAAQMHETHVRPRLVGLSHRWLRSVSCLYTVAPGFRFVIDRHPEWPNVLVASPCSGHGFKHSAAIGEALAEQAIEGRSRLDLTPFGTY